MRYYTFNGQVVAMRDSATNAVTYLHGDHLGSVSLATNSSGAVVSKQDFDPWGKVRGTSTIAQTSLNYTGQRLDGTGLLYYHARYYDPSLARFVSADSVVPGQDSKTGTANPQALNRYSYVGNNPLNHTDPTGHDWDHLAQFAEGVGEGVAQVAVSTVSAAADSISPITAIKQTVEFASDPAGYVGSRVQAVASTASTAWAGAQSAYNDPSGAGATLYDNSRAVGQVMGQALGTAGMAAGVSALGSATAGGPATSGNPKWPSMPQEMDEMLGFEGKRIPDTAGTPGRSKVTWETSQDVKITYEQHPYHATAPDWHKGPHWHLDTPGAPHVRYLPGDDIPGY